MSPTLQQSRTDSGERNMRPEIAQCCEIIAGDDCEGFLRLMRHAYFGDHEAAWRDGASLIPLAERIGVLKAVHKRLSLTPAGYLVGNVAKEYCNYLDQGRQLAPPKPP